MLFIDLLFPLLFSISVDALPSTDHSILLPSNQFNTSSSVQAISPVSVRCYGAVHWIRLDVKECADVFNEMHNDPDFSVENHYNLHHSSHINAWSAGLCDVMVARDDESLPPPHDIRFSTADVLRITLHTFTVCRDQGHGGLANMGRGYFFSVGRPSWPRSKH